MPEGIAAAAPSSSVPPLTTVPPMRWVALGVIILGVALQAFTGVAKHS